MFLEGLFVTVFSLKVLPFVPYPVSVVFRVCKLADVSVDGSGPFDFTHLYFDIGIFSADLQHLFLIQFLQSCVEYRPGFRNPQQFTHFCNVDVEGCISLVFRDIVDHPVVDLNRVRVQTVLFFKLCVHKVEYAGLVFCHLFQQPLEEGTSSFHSDSILGIPVDEFVQV